MDYLDESANPANLVTNPMMGYRKGRFQIEVFRVDMAIETENGCRLIRPLYFDGLVGPEHNWCQCLVYGSTANRFEASYEHMC